MCHWGLFYSDAVSPPITTIPLHAALPISEVGELDRRRRRLLDLLVADPPAAEEAVAAAAATGRRGRPRRLAAIALAPDRKSTPLNSSHVEISYAVICLKNNTTNRITKSTY